MENLEDALRNIDVFCKVLVDKLIADENEEGRDVFVEPMEKLIYEKSIIGERAETNLPVKHFIPLPHVEDPLIDVVEENDHFKILMQERCRDKTLTVHTDIDGIEICRRECQKDHEGQEVCVDKCQKVNLPVNHLQVENMSARCNNNAVFEVAIPKR